MRLPRLYSVTAAALIAPVLVVLPAHGEANPTPVSTTADKAPLVDPANPTVGDGEYATVADRALAKEKTPDVAASAASLEVLGATGRQAVDKSLAVIGVTWDGKTPLSVQYRTEGPQGWSTWETIETDTDGDAAEPGATTRSGSDPIVLTGVSAVQARILGAKGDAPRNPVLSVIDPKTSQADSATQSGSAAAAASRPTIRTRAQWGADERIRRGSPSYATVKGVVVHHTAGTNNYSPSQVPAILRGIYAFHVKDRGWSDVGYNFLVDKWGRVWQGRYGSMSGALVGAHASGFNGVTFGISVMGDYRNVQPSSAAISAVTQVIAWKASIHGFNPRSRFTFNGKSYRNVSGHRDVGNTSCPGLIYNYLPSIASRAASLKGGSVGNSGGASTPGVAKPPASPAVVSALRSSDAMLLGTTGRLYAVSSSGSDSVGFARAIDPADWRGYDFIRTTADLTGDRIPDLVVRSKQGVLSVRPGSASGVGSNRVVGGGWNRMTHILTVGDWNGDGRGDLLAVQRGTGRLFFYPGTGTGRFGRAVQVGSGWQGLRHVLAVGDWNGDRHPDLLGVTADGRALLYRGNGRGRFLSGTVALGSAAGYQRLVGMTGAGRALAIRADGSAAVLRATGGTLTATNVEPNFRGLTVFGG